jgi:penicillin-binding protein 1A
MARRRRTKRTEPLRFSFEPPPPPNRPDRPRRRKMRWLRFGLVLVLLFALSGVSAFFGFMTAIAQNAPDLAQFEKRTPPSVGFIYARDPSDPACQTVTPTSGHCRWIVIGTLHAPDARVLLEPTQINRTMKNAIVAVEDRRFYTNPGFDPQGIARALLNRVLLGSQEGASTITQQLVKNTYLTSAQTVRRKIQEIFLAYQLERQVHNKDRVLTDYLNTIYFGHGCYGIDAAAQYYFNTSPALLTVPQAATLAAIPKSPVRYDPLTHPQAALARRDLVIDDMVGQGYLSAMNGAEAKLAPLVTPGAKHQLTFGPTRVPYFVQYVTTLLENRYGPQAFTAGVKVYTSIDLREQALAERVVSNRLRALGPSGALVSIDPQTGEVKAMVGGDNFARTPFNIATDGHRQPGSSFKPFVLAAALRRGIQPATQFVSKRLVLQLDDKHYQLVLNDTPNYLGPIDLHTAMTVSDNTVFEQLTEAVHPQSVVDAAHAAGITSPLDPNLAIGLGGLRLGVTPLEMAHAFATFANRGVRIGGSILFHTPDAGYSSGDQDPRSILWVAFPDGRVDVNRVATRNAFARDSQVNDTDALTLLDTMRGVTQSGTGTKAAIPGRVVIGKTGTTSDYKDAWFVGMTPQRVTAVWVGYVNPSRSMKTEYYGQPVFGGTIPAEIFKTFMQQALAGQPPLDWPSSPGRYQEPVMVDTRRDPYLLAPYGCARAQGLVMAVAQVPNRTESPSACSGLLTIVPDLTGLSPRNAFTVADGQHLLFNYQLVPARPGQRTGVISGQVPQPGVSVPWNDAIEAYLPVKVPQVIVPGVVSRAGAPVSADAAVARLAASGFKVVIELAVQSGVPAGTVIGQDVRGGSLAPSGSIVTIAVVGAAPNAVAVPDIEGIVLSAAERRLRAVGLAFTTLRRDGGFAARTDVVITSDIQPGDLVPRGETIALTTSRPQDL